MIITDKKSIFGILVILFCANVLAWSAVYDLNKYHFLEVNFFDVGQGDAIFIETPEKHQILIDGGPNSLILEKLGKEMPFWDRTIDLIILTHPEYDHISGLIEVLKRYKVKNILWTGIVRDTVEYREWLKLIEKEKAQIFIAQFGQKIFCSDQKSKKCYFEIFNPFEKFEGKNFDDSNETSIVAKLIFGENYFLNSTEEKIQSYHGVRFLFTGDIYKSTEQKILNKDLNIESDVLKISHHGSKTSSSEEFIDRVSAEIAVISAGKDNSYGHPHKEVLDTLKKFGVKILRTDLEGDIKIVSDGKHIF